MQCHVFLVLAVQELAETDRVPSVTCVERDACSLLSASGEDGTEEATSSRRDTLLPLPLLLQPSFPWFKPEDTEWITSPSYLLLLATLLRKSNALKRLLDSLETLVPGLMSKRSSTLSRLELERVS